MTGETVFVAGFSHETNTFLPTRTGRERFQERRELFGDGVIDELRGTNTCIGGCVDVAEREGVDLVPGLAASAMPGGVVANEAYEFYTDRIVADLEAAGDVDGVFLSLHGAMVPEEGDDGEGPLLSRVREVVGADTPVVATLDLHGNVTDEMVEAADALIAYECYPHTDTGDTGRTAMELLLEAARGAVEPTMAIERPPVLPYGPAQNTREGPMADVMAFARELEARDGVLKANVLPGFYKCDFPEMGFSVPVVADGDDAVARDAARDLAERVWNDREAFVVDYPDPEAAVAEAADRIAAGETEDGPVVMAELGDNPGGGGFADRTELLEAMLDAGLENAGIALFHGPDLVERAAAAGAGERLTVDLGGSSPDPGSDPIADLEVYVKAVADGRYRNTGPMSTGTKNDLAGAVRLQTAGVTAGDDAAGTAAGDDGVAGGPVEVIVTTNRTQPYDAEIWRHLGIQPDRLDALVVKSSNHYRADYEPMASSVIPVDTPGMTAVDPGAFDRERVRRPQYPLDAMSDDAYPDWDAPAASGGDDA